MKATRSREHPTDTPITVRLSDGSLQDGLLLVVPISGADVDVVERALIAFALERTAGNRTRAA